MKRTLHCQMCIVRASCAQASLSEIFTIPGYLILYDSVCSRRVYPPLLCSPTNSSKYPPSFGYSIPLVFASTESTFISFNNQSPGPQIFQPYSISQTGRISLNSLVNFRVVSLFMLISCQLTKIGYFKIKAPNTHNIDTAGIRTITEEVLLRMFFVTLKFLLPHVCEVKFFSSFTLMNI